MNERAYVPNKKAKRPQDDQNYRDCLKHKIPSATSKNVALL